MNEIKKNGKKWFYWFILGVAIITFYKILEQFLQRHLSAPFRYKRILPHSKSVVKQKMCTKAKNFLTFADTYYIIRKIIGKGGISCGRNFSFTRPH